MLNLLQFLCEKFGRTVTSLSHFQNLGLSWKVYTFILLPLFSCGFGFLKKGTWNTLLQTVLCKRMQTNISRRTKMRCQRSYNHSARPVCCSSAVASQGRPGTEAGGQRSTVDQPPPSASLLLGVETESYQKGKQKRASVRTRNKKAQ